MKLDPILASLISDLFVNLAAGWLGVVFIVPTFSEEKGTRKFVVLTADILLAIFCLIAAFIFRKS